MTRIEGQALLVASSDFSISSSFMYSSAVASCPCSSNASLPNLAINLAFLSLSFPCLVSDTTADSLCIPQDMDAKISLSNDSIKK